jgi:hypothetical protein
MKTLQNRPSNAHEDQVDILHNIAILMGFSVPLVLLPDGSRPDVCRFDVATNGVFVGEAKATESPMCKATRVRYVNYIRWLVISRAHLSSSICAVCFGGLDKTILWENFLKEVLKESQITSYSIIVSRLQYPIGMVYAKLCP